MSCHSTDEKARVQKRAKPVENAWTQIFREAGGWTDPQAMTRNFGLPGVSPGDQSRPDGGTFGLSVHGGLPLAWDTTLRSPVRRDGTVRPGALLRAGSTFQDSRRGTRRDYRALDRSDRVVLLTLAGEVGGAWSSEAHRLIRDMARAKAERAAPPLRRALRASTHSPPGPVVVV